MKSKYSSYSFPISLSRSDISKSNRRDMQLRSAEIAPKGERKGEQNTDPGTHATRARRESIRPSSSHDTRVPACQLISFFRMKSQLR